LYIGSGDRGGSVGLYCYAWFHFWPNTVYLVAKGQDTLIEQSLTCTLTNSHVNLFLKLHNFIYTENSQKYFIRANFTWELWSQHFMLANALHNQWHCWMCFFSFFFYMCVCASAFAYVLGKGVNVSYYVWLSYME